MRVLAGKARRTAPGMQAQGGRCCDPHLYWPLGRCCCVWPCVVSWRMHCRHLGAASRHLHTCRHRHLPSRLLRVIMRPHVPSASARPCCAACPHASVYTTFTAADHAAALHAGTLSRRSAARLLGPVVLEWMEHQVSIDPRHRGGGLHDGADQALAPVCCARNKPRASARGLTCRAHGLGASTKGGPSGRRCSDPPLELLEHANARWALVHKRHKCLLRRCTCTGRCNHTLYTQVYTQHITAHNVPQPAAHIAAAQQHATANHSWHKRAHNPQQLRSSSRSTGAHSIAWLGMKGITHSPLVPSSIRNMHPPSRLGGGKGKNPGETNFCWCPSLCSARRYPLSLVVRPDGTGGAMPMPQGACMCTHVHMAITIQAKSRNRCGYAPHRMKDVRWLGSWLLISQGPLTLDRRPHAQP